MFLTCLYLAITAYVYSQILTQGGMLLNGWYLFLQRKIGHIPWLFKPLIECSKCVSGQLAFWYFLYYNFDDYSLVTHILFICVTIFLVNPVQALYKWKNQ